MHWPDSLRPGCSNRKIRAETWRALEELYEEGTEREEYGREQQGNVWKVTVASVNVIQKFEVPHKKKLSL